jgi:hypothetical protein
MREPSAGAETAEFEMKFNFEILLMVALQNL